VIFELYIYHMFYWSSLCRCDGCIHRRYQKC